MNRNEEIQKASQKRHLEKYGCDGFCAEFINGAKWADFTMIEKACKWIGNHLISVGIGGVIEEFKKVMEE